MTADRGEAIALFRFGLIAEAASPRLSKVQRGRIVRAAAARTHIHPDGSTIAVSRNTLDRWVRAYRERGLEGLRPTVRSDVGAVRRHPELFTEAAMLRREKPERGAGQIADILRLRHGIRVSERTIREQLRRRGLHRAALAPVPQAFGRYEASRPNERWIGDVLTGGYVPTPSTERSRRAKLFLLVDDHSRLLVHGRWVTEENTRAGQDVLRAAIARRGIPDQLYVDNGAPYANAALERTCAVLGIRLIHSRPYKPQGRGKQERLNRFIRERFLVEIDEIDTFEELNDRWMAWAESVLNTRLHSETGETPIARFLAGGPPRAADPIAFADAFRWSVFRRVTRTAMVSLAGNRYQVDPGLINRRVEVRYDPEDLTRLEVFCEGLPAGTATPFVVGRHTHPAVPQAARPPATPTGIDYLGLVLEAHEKTTRDAIAFRHLPAPNLDQQDTEDTP